MYSLRLLGVVAFEGPSGPVSGRATQRRRLALLALLAAAVEDGWTREKLIRLLWPETGDGQARHLLSDSLYVLRRELGQDAVSASREMVRLDPAVVWTDVAEFEAAIRKGELNEAVSLYRGPFLDGFYLGDGAELERWVDAERSRLAGLYAKALETLAQQAEGAGDSTSAVEWWQKRAAQDRYDSRIALRLMEAHVAAGNRGAALEQARVHELLMREEMGADPAPEVLAYAAKLREQQERVAAAGAMAERPAEARSEGARAVLSQTVVATPPAARSTVRKRALSVAAVTLAVIAGGAVLWLNRGPTGPAVRARFTQLTFSGRVLRAEISPNGDLLAYVEDGEPTRLLVRDLTGERSIEIANFEWVNSLRWSPDGSSLLLSGRDSTGQVAAVYPRLGGTRREVPKLGTYGAWSPDGSRVAWWQGARGIVMTTLTTGDTSRVSAPASVMWLHAGDWSPNGRLIALCAADSTVGHSMLWTGAVDGSGWRRLVSDTVGLSPPRWSPGGDAVYYLRGGIQGDSPGNELLKIRVTPEGEPRGVPEVLQVGLDADIRIGFVQGGLSLSADGRKLVYVKREPRSNLWSAVLEKHEVGARLAPVQLTRSTSWKSLLRPSPDGEWIAFTQYRQNEGDIFVIPAGGGSPRRVTSSGRAVSAPAWSPDGRILAYIVKLHGTGKVRTVPFEGGHEHTYEATDAAVGYYGYLAWAPGERILYRRPGNRNFHFLDPASEAEEPLVADPTVGFTFHARYSPTADHVALYWNRLLEGVWTPGIYAVAVRDSSESLLLPPDSALSFRRPIGWSADGSSVYVIEYDSGHILRVPVSGGEAGVVTTLPFEVSMSSRADFHCTATEREAGLTLLCTVPETVSDAWMIENFDPDIR